MNFADGRKPKQPEDPPLTSDFGTRCCREYGRQSTVQGSLPLVTSGSKLLARVKMGLLRKVCFSCGNNDFQRLDCRC